MKVSVVIATYNRRERLKSCLSNVTYQSHPAHEIIVVSDASTDKTVKMIRQEFPEIKLIIQNKNQGQATARNRGVREATGDIIAFTDDDCIVPDNWLAYLIDGFDRHPDIVGVGGYQEAAEALLQKSVVAQAERVRRLQRWGDRAFSEQKGGEEVPGLGTNNVAYRREALLAIGGFDTTFPVAAGEDTDLKLRIAQAGNQLLYLPLKVEHNHPYKLSDELRARVRRGIGAYFFEAKHGRKPTLFRIWLRILKRFFQFFPDLWHQPFRIAIILLITRIADAYGQLFMVIKTTVTKQVNS